MIREVFAFDYNIAHQWICYDTRKTFKNSNAKTFSKIVVYSVFL